MQKLDIQSHMAHTGHTHNVLCNPICVLTFLLTSTCIMFVFGTISAPPVVMMFALISLDTVINLACQKLY